MDIRAALKIPPREAKFKPSREGLSAAQIIHEMDRWYAGMPQDPSMDWQIRGLHMAESGRHHEGPWTCVECKQEAVHEPTYYGNYFIHKCPLWKPRTPMPRATPGWASQETDDGVEEAIKRHDLLVKGEL